jgi:uncharacterized PurR-regulated membrane protein YhhQ (DUF165 family)
VLANFGHSIFSLVVWWGVVDLVTTLKLGAVKFRFKIVIAMIDTTFIYWARSLFRRKLAPQAAPI